MIDIAKIKTGDKVCYTPNAENGIVKRVPENSVGNVYVVFECDGNWGSYQDYTGALTPVKALKMGWKH